METCGAFLCALNTEAFCLRTVALLRLEVEVHMDDKSPFSILSMQAEPFFRCYFNKIHALCASNEELHNNEVSSNFREGLFSINCHPKIEIFTLVYLNCYSRSNLICVKFNILIAAKGSLDDKSTCNGIQTILKDSILLVKRIR